RPGRIGGGPSCRQGGRLSWVFVPRRPRAASNQRPDSARARFGDSSSVDRSALDPGKLLTDASDITRTISAKNFDRELSTFCAVDCLGWREFSTLLKMFSTSKRALATLPHRGSRGAEDPRPSPARP